MNAVHTPDRTFVVIPAFNEATTIRSLVQCVLLAVPEVIVVDDGSTDGTGAQLARLHDKHNFPPHRYYANRLARFSISWAAGEPIADTQSGFRVYPAALIAQLTHADVSWGRFVFESEILIAASARGVRSVAVSIPGIYPPKARRSHFRPVVDVARIAAMVASRLIRRGMYPAGLWRSLNLPAAIAVVPDSTPGAGVAHGDSGSQTG